jgi:hypothetical protein
MLPNPQNIEILAPTKGQTVQGQPASAGVTNAFAAEPVLKPTAVDEVADT